MEYASWSCPICAPKGRYGVMSGTLSAFTAAVDHLRTRHGMPRKQADRMVESGIKRQKVAST
jgi:hypothetical protein